jgi:hypothetical protein
VETAIRFEDSLQSKPKVPAKRLGQSLYSLDTFLPTALQQVGRAPAEATFDGAKPDLKCLFIVPPGNWVDTIDQILDRWHENDKQCGACHNETTTNQRLHPNGDHVH